MSMELENDIFLKCDKCEKTIEIENRELEYYTESYDRQMGSEVMHIFSGEYKCPICMNEISFTISGWEYPIGVPNYDEYHISGGSFIEIPSLIIL